MVSQSQEITITRTIRALPARIYAAFTRAEGWCEWCCEKAEADAHVGGRLHIYTEGYNAYGEFTELEQDRTVALTWNGDGEPPMLIRVLLEGRDARYGIILAEVHCKIGQVFDDHHVVFGRQLADDPEFLFRETDP